jgi:hypothetical protein
MRFRLSEILPNNSMTRITKDTITQKLMQCFQNHDNFTKLAVFTLMQCFEKWSDLIN